MFCSNCGKEISEGSRFCANCGAPVGQPVNAYANGGQSMKKNGFAARVLTGTMATLFVFCGLAGCGEKEVQEAPKEKITITFMCFYACVNI